MRKEQRNYVVVGSFVLAMLVVLVLWIALLSGRTGATDGYSVVYRNVSGLKTGAEVLYEGFPVGVIEAIEPLDREGRRAYRVELAIRRGWPIPEDSRATISTGLFAAPTIDLRGGSAEGLVEPGGEIAAQEAADVFAAVNEVADRVVTLLEQSVEPTLRSVAEGTPPIVENLEGFTADLREAVAQINALLDPANVSRVANILENVETATQDAGELMAELGQTRRRLDTLVGRVDALLAEEDGEIGQAIHDLNHTLAALARHVDAITANLETTTRNLSEFSLQLRDNPGVLLRGRDVEQP